jgi:predicted CoA-binding protein
MSNGKQHKLTAVLGASNTPERYSNKAIRMLVEHGHEVIPVNPAQREIEGLSVASKLSDIEQNIDTVTVYLNPETVDKIVPEIIAAKPRRVVFNPGAESADAEQKLKASGIEVENACTLVLLSTGQY